MGELLWIDEDGLRDTIIMDPITFFVTPATRVIRKHTESEERGVIFSHQDDKQRECMRNYPRQWDTMVTTGIVQGNLLQALLGDHYGVIISLMIKFGLIVEILTQNESSDGKMIVQVKKYIVPSLLKPNLYEEQRQLPFPSLEPNYIEGSFFFSFFLPNQSYDWNKPLNETQLASQGYLPRGLFLRYLGKLLNLSQLITLGYDALSDQIYNNDATVIFGERSFRIRLFGEYNTISVTVTRGSNYAALLHRLKGILDDVVKECFGQLEFKVMFVHFVGGSYHYLPFDLVMNACKINQSVFLSNSISIDRLELYRKYSKWWEFHDTSRPCDVFLSYRWGEHDKRFVTLIYDALLDYYGYVFLDDQVIKESNNLQDTFSKALVTAKVFVPFCSHDALAKMKTHNPDEVDNVLLEWILALECEKKGSLNILPIPYGAINEAIPFEDFNYNGKC